MSPLKANVLINDLPHTIAVSVGKARLGLGWERILNIRIQSTTIDRKSPIIGKYKVVELYLGYGVVRCADCVPIATCCTLAQCQAVALSDYIQQAGLELVPEESTQEV